MIERLRPVMRLPPLFYKLRSVVNLIIVSGLFTVLGDLMIKVLRVI